MNLIVQDIPSNEDLVSAAQKLGIPYSLHKVIPFSDTVQPNIAPQSEGIVFGGRTLQKVAEAAGVKPGTFNSDCFTYSVMLENLSDLCLNFDANIGQFDSVSITEDSFIRPDADDKSFVGHIITPENLTAWQKSTELISADEYSTLYSHSKVVTAKAREIIEEYRVFIIGGKISVYSLYRKYGVYYPSNIVDKNILDFAAQIIQTWIPHECCVLDLALTETGIKVLEFNCLNDSGCYAANLEKLLQDLYEYLHE